MEYIQILNNSYTRAQAAKELGLTIDIIRNWEMNGLITIKRKENGYHNNAIENAYDVKEILNEIKNEK